MTPPLEDIVVLVPGILGSSLHKDGKAIWALSAAAGMRSLLTAGDSLRRLAVRDDDWREELDDGVTAESLLPDVHLIPGLWKIDGYGAVAARLKRTFDLQPGGNYFEFPYDWRRDVRAAARGLRDKVTGWLGDWRRRSGNPDARVVLLTHSMGGLVARYYLDCLEGWREARTLITFGTPFRGSLRALDQLSNGVRMGPFPSEPLTRLVRSLTSVYQLLPRYPCWDSGEGTLARVGEAEGIPNLDPERAAAALAFHYKLDRGAKERPPDSYRVLPIIGTHQPTPQSARLNRGRVELLRTLEGRNQGGDGTVPLVSGMPLGMEAGAFYASAAHASLQNAREVLTQVEGALTEDAIDFSALRSAFPQLRSVGDRALSLFLEDAYLAGETVRMRVTSGAGRDLPITTWVNLETGEEKVLEMASGDDDTRFHCELDPDPGLYRVIVRQQGADEVSDLCLVVDGDGTPPA